jgi:hypothetical protein
MIRTMTSGLSAILSSAEAKKGFWLLALNFSTPYRCTSHSADIVWDGHTWVKSTMIVQSPQMHKGGQTAGSVQFLNLDNLLGGLIQAYGLRGVGAELYLGYLDSNGDIEEVLTIFANGSTNGGNYGPKNAIINLRELQSAALEFAPRRLINSANGFNHVPADGKKITWRNETITIRSA